MRFEEEDVPYSHINTRADVPEDPQVKAMGAFLSASLLVDTAASCSVRTNTEYLYAHTPQLGEHLRGIGRAWLRKATLIGC